MESNLLSLQETELDKDFTFEVSKDVKVTAKITYKKGDVIEMLTTRIRKLETEVNNLNRQKCFVVEDSLRELWENEDDARWDEC